MAVLTFMSCQQGTKGDTGEAGPRGDPGTTGATGPQGSTGPQGPTGAQGAQGGVGPQGSPGAQGLQGVKGLTWRGAWDPATTYFADDAVEHGGSAFIALTTSTGAAPPSSTWQLLAAAGTAGATGATGAVGATGATGANGPQGLAGSNGVSVSGATLAPGHPTCLHGGSQFVSQSGTTYACNGAPGVTVAAVLLAPGADPACPAGGTRFTTGSAVTYACSSSPTGPCPAGKMLCGATCRNLLADPGNCGSCGTQCASRMCMNGLCAKLVFATSQAFTGALGGVSGGNAKCQAAAASAGLTGNYLAWLSDVYGNSPAANFTRSQAPYVQSNGAIVAADWSALVSTATTPLAAAIGLDENGFWPVQNNVWTGTTANGLIENLGAFNCDGWTSTNASGYTGTWGSRTTAWTQVGGRLCTTLNHLYCFEQ